MKIQDEFAAYNVASQTPIRVRIGIHAGEPVEDGNDLFGSAVQIAARICDLAQADAVLVSAAVRDACDGTGLAFEPSGTKSLKGFAQPVELFSPAPATRLESSARMSRIDAVDGSPSWMQRATAAIMVVRRAINCTN